MDLKQFLVSPLQNKPNLSFFVGSRQSLVSSQVWWACPSRWECWKWLRSCYCSIVFFLLLIIIFLLLPHYALLCYLFWALLASICSETSTFQSVFVVLLALTWKPVTCKSHFLHWFAGASLNSQFCQQSEDCDLPFHLTPWWGWRGAEHHTTSIVCRFVLLVWVDARL